VVWLIKQLLVFVASIRALYGLQQADFFRWPFWAVFCGSFAGMLPVRWLSQAGFYPDLGFSSVSYGISLLILLTVVPFIVSLFSRSQWDRWEIAFVVMGIPLFATLVTSIKVPVGILAVAAWCWIAVRLPNHRFSLGCSALLTVSGFALAAYYSVPPMPRLWAFFHYYRTHISDAARPWFFVVVFFWTIIYVYERIQETANDDALSSRKALKKGKLLDVELFVILVVLGLLPGSVLFLFGGGAEYFFDVHRWFSLPLVLALYPRWSAQDIAPLRFSTSRWKSVVVLLLFCGGGFAFKNTAEAVQRMVELNLDLRDRFERIASSGERIAKFQAERLKLIARLAQENDSSRNLRKNKALYVPRDALFWNMLPHCEAVPFVGPALSGLAMVNGLPAPRCIAENYGYSTYSKAERREDPNPCVRASEMGFNAVVTFAAPRSQLVVTMNDCRGL
jgi:hypothetical protein